MQPTYIVVPEVREVGNETPTALYPFVDDEKLTGKPPAAVTRKMIFCPLNGVPDEGPKSNGVVCAVAIKMSLLSVSGLYGDPENEVFVLMRD